MAIRNDAVGFFWDDTPPPKPPKAEKAKRIPPNPVWLRADYLPGLEEALRFPVQIMTLEDLAMAVKHKEEFILDVECYPNYFLVAFRSIVTGKVTYLEEVEGGPRLDRQMLVWLLTTFTVVTFNGISYDIPICNLASAGFSTRELKRATDQIILEEIRGSDVQRAAKVKSLKIDHIDLIEVAPLFASLKTYAGRLHAPKMQDLPFHPNTVLSAEQIAIVRWYCINTDTTNTALLRECLRQHIDLRYALSNEVGVDLRSKSDAQIAEAVMAAELQRISGQRPKKPEIEVGTTYHYNVPKFIQFRSPLMNWALSVITHARFVVDFTGSIAMPEEVKALMLDINGSVYRMGIGGLHSSESTIAHHSDSEYILIDKDVTSFYPYIILNQGLYPEHLGPAFLTVYRNIVERRVAAKARKDTVIADSLKIVVNGSFGKLGSKYSILYAPHFLIQTTITGQLSILMLIERLEYGGIHVVSANTDGIVIKCPRAMRAQFDAIVAGWERDTNFLTEETIYRSLYSRDVNNYIAVKEDGTTKGKGAYANPWGSEKNLGDRLHKNPTTTICVEAVEALLTKGTPITTTIANCRDIRKFVTVRSVKGGAVKVWDRLPPPEHSTREELLTMAGWSQFSKDSWGTDALGRTAIPIDRAYEKACDQMRAPGHTEYIGKTVRWYYAKDVPGELVYAQSGNKVPRSDGAKPLMLLGAELPSDVDFKWYEDEAYKILEAIGVPA